MKNNKTEHVTMASLMFQPTKGSALWQYTIQLTNGKDLWGIVSSTAHTNRQH